MFHAQRASSKLTHLRAISLCISYALGITLWHRNEEHLHLSKETADCIPWETSSSRR